MSKKIFKHYQRRLIHLVTSIVHRSFQYNYSLSSVNVSTTDDNIKSMGQFLEKPKIEKHNSRGKNDDIRYGLGSMQGWR
ncbi:unnamed protein product, partial [Rotaria sordida]